MHHNRYVYQHSSRHLIIAHSLNPTTELKANPLGKSVIITRDIGEGEEIKAKPESISNDKLFDEPLKA